MLGNNVGAQTLSVGPGAEVEDAYCSAAIERDRTPKPDAPPPPPPLEVVAWTIQHSTTSPVTLCPITGEPVGRRAGDIGWRLFGVMNRPHRNADLVSPSVAKTAPADIRQLLARVVAADAAPGEQGWSIVPLSLAHPRQTYCAAGGMDSGDPVARFGPWGLASRMAGSSSTVKLIGMTAALKHCPTLLRVLCDTFGVEHPADRDARLARDEQEQRDAEAAEQERAREERLQTNQDRLRAALESVAAAMAPEGAKPDRQRAAKLVTSLAELLGLDPPAAEILDPE